MPDETKVLVFPWENTEGYHVRMIAERALQRLPQHQQISEITLVMLDAPNRLHDHGEDATRMLSSLIRIFGDSKTDFRVHARWIYTELNDKFPSGSFAKLNLIILREVLKGWGPDQEDAEDCFTFICGEYERSGRRPPNEPSLTQKAILDLFRERLSVPGRGFSPQEMIPWIIREDTPVEVAKVLLHWRVNAGWSDEPSRHGVEVIREELRQLARS